MESTDHKTFSPKWTVKIGYKTLFLRFKSAFEKI
jgi:hypothetical protein